MIIAGLTAAAVTASKWILAAKIMTIVGSTMVATAPAFEKIKDERKR